MRRGTLLILAIALAPAVATPAIAATFYVDPATGSIANDGSADHPWNTLQAVFSSGKIQSKNSSGDIINPSGPVHAGDSILLRSGYHGDVNVSGYYNDAAITVAAQPGHTPALRRLSISGFKNWVFDGLTVSPELSPSFARLTQINIGGGSSYVTVQNCHCYSVDDVSGYTANQWVANTGNGIGVGSSCHHISLLDNIVRNTAFGINLSGTDTIARGNQVINFRGDGMRALNDDLTLEYNTIKNCYDVDDNHDDGIQCYRTGTISGPIYNMVVRGNLIINTEDPSQPLQGTLQGMGFFDGQHINFLIENNLVITDHWHGITILGAEDCTVINNTAVNPRWLNGLSTLRTWIEVSENKDGTLATNNVIRNNIAHNFLTGGNVNLVFDHNLVVTAANAAQVFADWQNGDFHLAADSPAIDAGSPVGAPAIDFEGNARPAGAAWDIGAFEYGALPGPPVAYAGSDQEVADTDRNGWEAVTLDGSASYDPDGTITSWAWTEGTTVLGTGETVQVDLPRGVHAIALTVATDDDPPETAMDTVVVTVSETVPLDASLAWQNFAYALQTTPFAVEFDARPNAASVDSVLGLCYGDADWYTDLACIVRFYTNGRIEVRSAGAYTADVAVDYVPGTWYHFRMIVNPAAHTYSVYVKPEGGAEIVLATNYAFRSDQATLSQFNRWAVVNTTTSGMSVDHFAVGPPVPLLRVTSWAVAADHRAAGTFVTPASEGSGEPRMAGLRQLEITFNKPLAPATVVPGAVSVLGVSGGDVSSLISSLSLDPAGTTLMVGLSSAPPDGDRYVVAATDVLRDTDGSAPTGSTSVLLRVLAGDVDNSGMVTPVDLLAVRAMAGSPVTTGTMLFDLDGSGVITGADLLVVRSRMGHSLP